MLNTAIWASCMYFEKQYKYCELLGAVLYIQAIQEER